jgi:hypothetical protein
MEDFETRRARIKRTGRLRPLKKLAKFQSIANALRKVKTETDLRGREFVRGSYLMWLYCHPRTGGWRAWTAGAAMRQNGWRPTKRTLEGRRGQVWIDWPIYTHGEIRGRPHGCTDVVPRVRSCRSRKPRIEVARQGRPQGSRDSKPRRGCRPSPASVAAAWRERRGGHVK